MARQGFSIPCWRARSFWCAVGGGTTPFARIGMYTGRDPHEPAEQAEKTGLMEIDGLFINRSDIIQKVRIGRVDESSCAAKRFPGPIAIAPNFSPVRSGTSQKYFWADLSRGKHFSGPNADEAKIFPARSDPIFGDRFRRTLFVVGMGPTDFSGPNGYAPNFFLTRSELCRKFFRRDGR
jgi:hypothetical protein